MLNDSVMPVDCSITSTHVSAGSLGAEQFYVLALGLLQMMNHKTKPFIAMFATRIPSTPVLSGTHSLTTAILVVN